MACALLLAAGAAAQQPAVSDPLAPGIQLARENKFAAAAREFTKVLKADPANRRAAALLAAMELQSGQAQEAIARARGLLEGDPQNPDLHELLGQAYMAARDWKSAAAEWQWLIQARPDFDQGHLQLAAVLLQLDRYQEALHEVSRALEISPGRGDARSLRGNILASLGRLDDAAQDWSVALVKDPEDSVALAGLAVYFRKSAPDRALEYGRKALQSSGGKTLGPYRVLAMVHRERGETQEAIRLLERALKMFPDSDLLASELRLLRGGKPAPPVRAAAAPSPAAPKPAESPSLLPPAVLTGMTLGTPAPDLMPLLALPARPRDPEPPPRVVKAFKPSETRRSTPRRTAPAVAAELPRAAPAELAAPELGTGLLPLSALAPPFVYGNAVLPPPAPAEGSLGEVARRLREQKQPPKEKRP
jgi:tetratricopeptide (TPR) repeat protein